MANALYNKAKEALLTASINMSSDTIKAVGYTSGYTPNTSTDQFLSTVGANTVGTAQTLTSKTVTGGVFDAADSVFSAVPSGAAMVGLLIYKDTGSAATSPLIAKIDTATGLPVTPNGGDINVVWDAAGIFAL